MSYAQRKNHQVPMGVVCWVCTLPLPLVLQDLNTLWQTMDVDSAGLVNELCVLPCLVGEMSERRKDSVRKVGACTHTDTHTQRHARRHAHTPTGMYTCTPEEVMQHPGILQSHLCPSLCVVAVAHCDDRYRRVKWGHTHCLTRLVMSPLWQLYRHHVMGSDRRHVMGLAGRK